MAEDRKPVLVLRNRQRTRELNLPLLRQIARHVLVNALNAPDYELGFHFVAAAEMARINEQFLQHQGSTDVITFDHGSVAARPHGEIFISVPDAVKQARQFETTWQSEIVRYLIHGLLHLHGLDDRHPDQRRQMKREENRLLRSVASAFRIDGIERRRQSKAGTQRHP